ncbi:MAG: DUF4390 domain-containing protein [Candidatus Zixiibacteriota bacterium]
MSSRFCLLAIALVLMLASVARTQTSEPDVINFDIFDNNGGMTVWLNLSPLISSRRIDLMREGVDHAIEYTISLHRPKKFWGSREISEVTGVNKFGYRIVTEDYFFSDLSTDSVVERNFLSLARLHQFMVDSINIGLAVIDSLERGKSYFVEIAVTCISLTGLNLADIERADTTGESPIRWLFRGFLDLTDFGREDWKVKSRDFLLSEITPRQ